ncbi:MAG: DUF3108 domain-containing protein [Gemmatimonadaceae bacterium]
MTHAVLTALALLALIAGPSAGAQEGSVAPASAPGRVIVPFAVGERSVFDVKFGALKAGTGTMEVTGIENVRDREAWHTVFSVRGGLAFIKVNDRYESWIDTRTFASLRHVQDIDEGSYEKERRYEIFPERGVYTENNGEEKPTVKDPLDDGSFLYFARTLPLSVGQTYEFPRYFRLDRNPVTIRVLRNETIKVPAGTFKTVVIQPIIKSRGIFSENGHAEIWLTDDPRRIMVQMKVRTKFGTLSLYLRSFRPGAANDTSGQTPAGQGSRQ